jgi:glycosyltransferase involved in cell wall biosynthesis
VVGRLSREKGVHILLEAAAAIRDTAPAFEVRIYGTGPEKKALQDTARKLSLTEVVHFEGFRDSLDTVYPQLDLLVLPSLSEGHPLVILEAWQHAVGIVATRAGGIPEVITHRESGLLCDTNDSSALANAIRHALDHPEDMAEYGRAGFRLLRARYSFARQAERLDAIYSELLAEQQSAGRLRA